MIKLDTNLGNDKFDIWVCDACGSYIPRKKGSPKPRCEYCRRVRVSAE